MSSLTTVDANVVSPIYPLGDGRQRRQITDRAGVLFHFLGGRLRFCGLYGRLSNDGRGVRWHEGRHILRE